jgi:hypothetical protein
MCRTDSKRLKLLEALLRRLEEIEEEEEDIIDEFEWE